MEIDIIIYVNYFYKRTLLTSLPTMELVAIKSLPRLICFWSISVAVFTFSLHMFSFSHSRVKLFIKRQYLPSLCTGVNK